MRTNKGLISPLKLTPKHLNFVIESSVDAQPSSLGQINAYVKTPRSGRGSKRYRS